MSSCLDVLKALSANAPDHAVLEGPSGVLSATELLARVQGLARELRDANAQVVGLLSDNSIDWAIADLACQCHDVCLVPIPLFFSETQLRHVVESGCVDTILFDAQSRERITALYGNKHERLLADTPTLHLCQLTVSGAASVPANTAKITFTSGSTGSPKGVCLSSSQCYRVADSLAKAVAEEAPRHLCVLPLSTLLENIGGLYMPLISSGTSLVYPLEYLGMAGSCGVQPQRFLQAIDELQPTTMILVPQLLALLDSAVSSGWRVPDSLRFVAVGGGRVATAVLSRLRKAGLPVYEGYGLSECASVVALNTPDHDQAGTSGRVLSHVSVSQHKGELVVSGSTFLGYLNEPETWGAQRIHTGDLGHITADGFVTVSGRSKNVLVSSFGRNISPEWVEAELLATDVIAQAMVLGDDRPQCTALLLAATAEVDDQAIQLAIDSVNETLPDYARVEGWLRIMRPFSTSEGTLTDNGRLRREQILQIYAEDIEHIYKQQQEPIAV